MKMGMEDYLTAGRGFVQQDAALCQLCKSPVNAVQCFLGFAVLVEDGWLLPRLLLQPLSPWAASGQEHRRVNGIALVSFSEKHLSWFILEYFH